MKKKSIAVSDYSRVIFFINFSNISFAKKNDEKLRKNGNYYFYY